MFLAWFPSELHVKGQVYLLWIHQQIFAHGQVIGLATLSCYFFPLVCTILIWQERTSSNNSLENVGLWLLAIQRTFSRLRSNLLGNCRNSGMIWNHLCSLIWFSIWYKFPKISFSQLQLPNSLLFHYQQTRCEERVQRLEKDDFKENILFHWDF